MSTYASIHPRADAHTRLRASSGTTRDGKRLVWLDIDGDATIHLSLELVRSLRQALDEAEQLLAESAPVEVTTLAIDRAPSTKDM